VLVGAAVGRVVALSPAGRDALNGLMTGGEAGPAARALGRRLMAAGLAHPRPPVAVTAPKPSVTVVIPVRDRPASLSRLLRALGARYPVVVVDDGSADSAAVVAVCARHGASLQTRATSGGPGAARNTALDVVRTELVAFIDSDCLPEDDWIDRLAPHFGDAGVGAVAPRILPQRCGGTVLQRYTGARSPLDLGADEGLVGPGQPLAYVPTAALLLRRSTLAGGFDEALRYGEDVDAVWRLHDAGWSVRYDPCVVVHHDEPASWSGLLGRRLRYGASAAPLAARHGDRLAPVIVRPWPTAAWLAALCGRPRLALGCSGAAALLLIRRTHRVGVPVPTAIRWSFRSTALSAVALGRACTMLAGPALFVAFARHHRSRGPVAALLLVPPLADWVTHRPPLDPIRWTIASVTDDLAYGLGVWRGCLRERTIAPIMPSCPGLSRMRAWFGDRTG
jgi:mycofactocin system glycosyltransferase